MLKRIYIHREIVFKVAASLIKYIFLQYLYSDAVFLNKVILANHPRLNKKENLSSSMQPFNKLTRTIDRVINRIYPNADCVIRSLVKREILADYGMKTELCFGLYKEDSDIRAHAWLSEEGNAGFSKVYQVS